MLKGLGFILLLAVLGTTAQAGVPPVEFTSLGLDADGKLYRYRIEVLTAKPVSQVDFNLRLFAADGRVIFDRPLSWRNLSEGQPQPIETGKTYTVTEVLTKEGAARAQGSLLRVVFADGTGWTPAVLSW